MWKKVEVPEVKRNVPYASGEKTREECRNPKVALDRRRAEAGLEWYQSGSLYDLRNAIPLLEEASAVGYLKSPSAIHPCLEFIAIEPESELLRHEALVGDCRCRVASEA